MTSIFDEGWMCDSESWKEEGKSGVFWSHGKSLLHGRMVIKNINWGHMLKLREIWGKQSDPVFAQNPGETMWLAGWAGDAETDAAYPRLRIL